MRGHSILRGRIEFGADRSGISSGTQHSDSLGGISGTGECGKWHPGIDRELSGKQHQHNIAVFSGTDSVGDGHGGGQRFSEDGAG